MRRDYGLPPHEKYRPTVEQGTQTPVLYRRKINSLQAKPPGSSAPYGCAWRGGAPKDCHAKNIALYYNLPEPIAYPVDLVTTQASPRSLLATGFPSRQQNLNARPLA